MCFACKQFLTMFALETFVLVVNTVVMLTFSGCMRKGPTTFRHITNEWFLARMNVHVLTQRWLYDKSLATDVTL